MWLLVRTEGIDVAIVLEEGTILLGIYHAFHAERFELLLWPNSQNMSIFSDSKIP